MKIVFLSDTHNKEVPVPAADVLVHCGDMTMAGTVGEISAFNAWMMKLPHKRKVVIPGNHDWLFERRKDYAKSLLSPDITYLEDSGTEIDGVKFWGTPWTNNFGDWAFMTRPEWQEAKFRQIPKDTDVLISHGPPKGVLDQCEKPNFEWDDGYTPRSKTTTEHAGSAQLRDILERRKPRIVAFGHIHEGYGEFRHFGTHYINCSIMDGGYKPVNKPIVVEI